MDDAIKLIKSLLTTTIGGVLVSDLNRDYKEMVGKPIPFREFGFDTLADFLRSTNQFSGTKTANGIKVTIKIPGKSAHIISAVQRQNTSAAEKKRRKRGMTKAGPSSLQSRKLISSQVMKRNSGGSAITKIRTRVQPQRSVYQKSTMKPIAPPKMTAPPTQTIGTSQPPVRAMGQTEQLKKINIHERFVPKQPFQQTTPMVTEPLTPPSTSPVRFHNKSPKTPPYDDRLNDRSIRQNLLIRLAPKQTESLVSSPKHEDQRTNTAPIGRLALRKICQSHCSVAGSLSSDTRLQMNCNDNNNDTEQKPCDINSRLQSEPVPLGKTISRRDLYARLAPKATTPANQEKPIDDVQTNDKSPSNMAHNALNGTNIEKTDISSQLQPKQIDTELPELQQINQKVISTHHSF